MIRVSLWLVAALLSISLSKANNLKCGNSNYDLVGGRCLRLQPKRTKSFDSAQQACLADGAQLVMPNSQAEQESLLSWSQIPNKKKTELWVGLQTSTRFTWVNNSTLDSTDSKWINWGKGRKNKETCKAGCVILSKAKAEWSTGKCTSRHGLYAVCQMDAEISAPTSCLPSAGSVPSQVVKLPELNNTNVLCDTVTEGGGWVVFQRRASAATDFNQNWAEYAAGFGVVSNTSNFWLGLDKINQMCGSLSAKCELRVDMEYEGTSYYAQYSSFYVGDESENYPLYVASYSGTAGNALEYTGSSGPQTTKVANGMQFSTPDRDNDEYSGNCAAFWQNGWWMNACSYAQPNGIWGTPDWAEGVFWQTLTGIDNSVSSIAMKMRHNL